MEQIYEKFLSFIEAAPKFSEHFPLIKKIKPCRLYLDRDIMNMHPRCLTLLTYILSHLESHSIDDPDYYVKSMTIDLHPDKTGIARQNLPKVIESLAPHNIIQKYSDRGYIYMVNPQVYNTIKPKMAAKFNREFKQWLALRLQPQPPLWFE